MGLMHQRRKGKMKDAMKIYRLLRIITKQTPITSEEAFLTLRPWATNMNEQEIIENCTWMLAQELIRKDLEG